MQKITPFLWFDNQAEEAMNFYTSIFKNSKAGKVVRYGDAGPGPKGSAMIASFELEGLGFTALNGGPSHKFTEAISLFVNCESQDEVDYFWNSRPAEAAGRSGSAEGEPGHAGDAADDEDRYRQARAGREGLMG
jgi:predicted 3-demethylubiquinone-9 3-methyltransferase (glyoxalase superfamily)